MKRKGILNRQILELISKVGHGDLIVITDRGFPFPKNNSTEIIDLGFVPGVPSFEQVIFPLIDEIDVEGYVFAEEMKKFNLSMVEQFENYPLIRDNTEISRKVIPHKEFKDLVLNESGNYPAVTGFIRTGEFTRYTNIILQCGVVF